MMDFIIEKGTLMQFVGDSVDVTIPPEVERIGTDAFSGSAVKRVVFPGSVKEIGYHSFYQCEELEEVSFAFGLTKIDAYAFAKCPMLTRLGAFPLTLKEIGQGAFYRTGITEVHIPPFVEKIGNIAFGFCEHLYIVSLPKMYSIGFAPFRGSPWILAEEAEQVIYKNGVAVGLRDPNVKNIKLLKNTTGIGSSAFSGTAIRSVSIPPSVKTIGENAFSMCKSLETVIMETGKEGAGPEVIGENAFYHCTSLKHLELGNRVMMIEESAFERCKALQRVDLPASLRILGKKCFYRTGLQEVDLPPQLRYVEKGAFARSKLKSVRNHSTVLRYFAEDALLMQNNRRVYCLPVEGVGIESACRNNVACLIGPDEEAALRERPIGGEEPGGLAPVLCLRRPSVDYRIDVVQGRRLRNDDWLLYGYYCNGSVKRFVSVTADELLHVCNRWIAYPVA